MPDDAPVSVAPALPWPTRAAAGLAGAAAVVFGVLAIFHNHDGVASAVLLVIGAAFGLMAITGYAITKIKAGDYEITLEAVREARLAWAQGDEERAEAILSSIVRRPGPQASATVAAWRTPWNAPVSASDGYIYQRQVLEVVASVLPADAKLGEQEAALSGIEAFIEFPEGTRIGIDIRAGTHFDLRAVAERISAALTYARPGLAGLIVVIRAEPDSRRAGQLRTAIGKVQAPVTVVTWNPGEREDVIRDAIMEMIPRVR